jgi:hypothetical protein
LGERDAAGSVLVDSVEVGFYDGHLGVGGWVVREEGWGVRGKRWWWVMIDGE